MTGAQPTERIVISHEELQDSAIDERLAQQRSAGPAALQPIEERGWLDFVYATSFYLMLAGACGALVAWAIAEPSFEDGVRFTGRVEQVQAQDVVPGTRIIQVSGVPVIVLAAATHVRAAGNSQVGYTVDDLRPDATVTVLGEAADASSPLVAQAIRIEPPETTAPGQFDFAAAYRRQEFTGLLMFPLVAGLIGLAIGSIEGLICRTLSRAVRSGLLGLLAGLLGGAVSAIAAGLVYEGIAKVGSPSLDDLQGFVLQMFRRGLAWTIAGAAMGLGQGLALKNRRLMLNGFIGGLVGGLAGGLVFDPIYMLVADPANMEGGEASRAIGFGIIGAAVGLFIGVTDMLTRAAWLRVAAGPLRGKEFSFTQTPIRLGSSPKNEIYLFKDLKIDPVHAVIDKLRDTYEITDHSSSTGTLVNRQRIRRVRLNDGDHITIGDSEFVYTTRDKRRA